MEDNTDESGVFCVSHIDELPILAKDIAVETRHDPLLSKVLHLTLSGWPMNTVSVQRGGSVTIPCFYDNIYQKHEKYWCRGSDWSSCTPIVHTDHPMISGDVSISDDPTKAVFTVTINNLTSGDSGSYWCGVEIGRGYTVGRQVSLSVTEGKMSVLQTVANEMLSLKNVIQVERRKYFRKYSISIF
uniref:Ig-like domain-containing protein n=1 Tax=Paramormyrops kingsleyae TaxID=1676925 RepID=A0A3B3QPK3_9TELE